MKMTPARMVLVRVLPHFPAVTSLIMAVFTTTQNKKPIMIREDSRDSWDFCGTKLNLIHIH